MRGIAGLAILGMLALIGAAAGYFATNGFTSFSIEPITTSQFQAFSGTLATSATTYKCESYDKCVVTFSGNWRNGYPYTFNSFTAAASQQTCGVGNTYVGVYSGSFSASATVNKGETAYLCNGVPLYTSGWAMTVSNIQVTDYLNNCPIGAVTPPTTLFSAANGPYSQCQGSAYCTQCIQGGSNNFQYCQVSVTKSDGTVLYSGLIDRNASLIDFTDGQKTIVNGIPASIAASTNYEIMGFKCRDSCGDGICQASFGETTVTCQSDCHVAQSCGDGSVTGTEVCDPQDSATNTASCTAGSVAGTMPCKNDCTGYDTTQCTTTPVCGNGKVESSRGETCDDGNTASNDGCSSTCKIEYCGDLITQSGRPIMNASGSAVPGTSGLTEQCDGLIPGATQSCTKNGLTGVIKCDGTCQNACDISGAQCALTDPPRPCPNNFGGTQSCVLDSQNKGVWKVDSVGAPVCINGGVCYYTPANPQTRQDQILVTGTSAFSGCYFNNVCQQNNQYLPVPSAQCVAGAKRGATNAATGKLGTESCLGGTGSTCGTWSGIVDDSQSQCVVGQTGQPGQSCGNGGHYNCVATPISGYNYGRYDISACVGSGTCANGQTRVVTGTLGWTVTETCSANNWPTSCSAGQTCASYVDACAPNATVSCDLSGIPGQNVCADRVSGFSACQATGVCAPGSTQQAGDCGQQTCTPSGVWGPPVSQPASCSNSQFTCQKETTSQPLTFLIFTIGTSTVDTGRYVCAPIVPIISPTIDPDGYAIISPINIPVTITAPAGQTLEGLQVLADIVKPDTTTLLSTGKGLFTDAVGKTVLSFTPQLASPGTYNVVFKVTVAGNESSLSKSIIVKGKVAPGTVFDQVQYTNKPITVLFRFTDPQGNLVTQVASLVVKGNIGGFDVTPQVSSVANGFQASFDVQRAGTLAVTATYKLTVDAKEVPVSANVDVKQPFIQVQTQLPDAVAPGTYSIRLKFTTPQNEPITLPATAYTVTLVKPDNSQATLDTQPTFVPGEYSASTNFGDPGIYYYKIAINTPGFEQRTYGADPFPVLKSTIKSVGGGSAPGVENTLSNTPLLIGIVLVIVVVIVAGIAFMRRS